MRIFAPSKVKQVKLYDNETVYFNDAIRLRNITIRNCSGMVWPLYRKTGSFFVQCNENGYTEGTLEFYVSSGTGGSGQGISKSEFESNK